MADDPAEPSSDVAEEMNCAAYNGLANGDLAPLAAYIRAEHPLDRGLSLIVADMLEGKDCAYRLKLIAKRPGYRGFDHAMDTYDRKMAIGVFIEGELRRLPRGSYDSVIYDARRRFRIGKSAAAEALVYLRDQIKRAEYAPGFDHLDHFNFLQAFYTGRFE